MSEEIRLLNCDARELHRHLEGESVALLAADPPWQYSDGSRSKLRGLASSHYDLLSDREIANILAEFYFRCQDDAYMVLWCTFPKQEEWFETWARVRQDFTDQGHKLFRYVGGGAWGKTTGLGVGHNWRGDAEPILLYKKGHAVPQGNSQSNLFLTPRTDIHSEKPRPVLTELVRTFCPPSGLVLDPFAGESASLAIACRSMGRRYLGAEISPERHALALARLSQQEMALLEPEELGAAS